MTIEKMIELTHFTPTEMIMADYILNNKSEVMTQSIQELEQTLFISKSAIIRFCKKLHFKGFNELKVQLARENSEQVISTHLVNVNFPFNLTDGAKNIARKMMDLYDVTIRDTCSCINYTKLEKVAKLLNEAEKIDIYTHAHNFNIAENFKDKMITIGKQVNCIENFYHQRLKALASDKNTVAIILSYSAKASWIPTILKKLYELHIPVILIGRVGSSHFSNWVTYFLGISNLENIRDRLSQFSSHISLQFMMDVLYSCIYQIDYEKNTDYIYRSIEYMDDRNP